MEATGKLITVEMVELNLRMDAAEFDEVKGGLVALPDPTEEQFRTLKDMGTVLEGVVLEEDAA